jgi:hypothetical protein
MALKWFDGGEVWGSNTYQARAYTQSDASQVTPGRIVPGLYSLSLSNGSMTTPSLGAQNTWYLGMGVKAYQNNWKLEVLTGATEQCHFIINDLGSGISELELRRGATLIDTSASFVDDVWGYLEIQITARTGANGSYEVWMNEVSIMSGTGVDLADTGGDGADVFSWGNGTSFQCDDIYILDTTGSLNTGRLGEQVCVGIVPTAEGHQIDFTPSSGVDNALLVDDPTTAPDDNDYVSSSAALDEDYYVYENMPSTGLGTVNGVRMVHGAHLDSAGTRTVQPRAYISAAEYDFGGDFVVDGASIFEHSIIAEASPATAVKWTKTEIDNAEFGMELSV